MKGLQNSMSHAPAGSRQTPIVRGMTDQDFVSRAIRIFPEKEKRKI